MRIRSDDPDLLHPLLKELPGLAAWTLGEHETWLRTRCRSADVVALSRRLRAGLVLLPG